MTRITWRDHARGSDGYAGDRQLFSIRLGGTHAARPVMWTPLVDHGDALDRPVRGGSIDLLKARAERLLEDFVHDLGATFKEGEA